MPIFRKKADPISQRSKELSEQIRSLEAEIKQISGKIDHSRSHPRVRSTAAPRKPTVLAGPAPPPRDPVFEKLNYQRANEPPETEADSGRYNDLGVRKYDIAGAVRRLKRQFRGQATANPKLVSYLAAGSIKGLRPLRYEKRIARNRFIMLSMFFLLILLGLVLAFHNP